MAARVQAPPSLDETNQCVWRGGRRIDLQPKAFQVLRCLVGQANRLVTKAELLDVVWPDTHVTEAVLTVAIAQLREVLGDDARRPRFIETVHRRGYRWIADGTIDVAPPAQAPPSAAGRAHGRASELGRLEHALAAAVAGRRQIVFVTGDPGIGKTTLLDGFLDGLAGGPALVLRGQCVDAYGTGEAYLPVLDALDGVGRDDARLDVVGLLRVHAPTWLLQLPGMLAPAEAEVLRGSLAASTPERMTRELPRLLEALAAERPLVLVLEDMHWSDHATVAALAVLAARREPARILVLASYRPVDAISNAHPIVRLKHELSVRRQCSEILLDGLDAGGVRGYLDGRFGAGRFPADLAERLRAQTSGNPLFLVNAVDHLVELGRLCEGSTGWSLRGEGGALDDVVPDGTREMIGFRLAQLTAAERELLEAASVVGVTFPVQALAAALGRSPVEVETACAPLVRDTQFLLETPASPWPDGSTGAHYAFRHALYRQVLYGCVTSARRRLLHQRVAERLEAGYGDDGGESAGSLAHHFERGGDLARAIHHRRAAAQVARQRFAFAHAIEHLRHALAVLERLPASAERDASEGELCAAILGPLHAVVAPSSEIIATAGRIRALAHGRAPTIALFQALGSLIGVSLVGLDLPAVRSACDEAVARAAEVEWGGLFASIAAGFLGSCRLIRGELAAGVEALERSIALPALVPMAPIEPCIMAESDAGLGRCLLGEPGRGVDMLRAARARADEGRHPPTIAYALANVLRGGLLVRSAAMVADATAALAGLRERGDVRMYDGLPEIGRGWLRATEGDAGGIDAIVRGRRSGLARAYRLNQAQYGALAVEALLAFECTDHAERLFEETAALAAEGDEGWWQAELLRLRGEVRLARRRGQRRGTRRWHALADEAEGCFREALALAAAQGARWWTLRASVSLGHLLAEYGRVSEARVLFEVGEGWGASELAFADVAEARTGLADLDEPAARTAT